MNCKHCGDTHIQKRGKLTLSSGQIVKRYLCTKCKKFQQSPPRHDRSARILLLDIETLPGEYYAFDPKVEYLSPDKQIKDWSICCWAAKWLFEPEVMGQAVTPREAVNRTDRSILGKVWNLMNDADIIVWQNGRRFDAKKMNTRFVLEGYSPPSQYMDVDTLAVARDVFGFSYNRLDELGKKFGIGEKTEMTFYDWKKCTLGDQEHISKMLQYCQRDVAPLLEDVYLTMLPFMRNHPNLNLFTDHDGDVCRNCESTDLKWNGTYKTPQGLWEGWRCNACGAVGRGTGKIHKIKGASLT